MTDHPKQPNHQRLQEGTGHHRIVYELYPKHTWPAPAVPLDWFEIALHAELDAYLPPDHPRSREAFSGLVDVAELLIQRLPAQAPYMVALSGSYYTLHPPVRAESIPRKLSRSLSLVFSNVGPYRHPDDLPLIVGLETQLNALNIAKLGSDGGDERALNTPKEPNDSTDPIY